MELADKPRPEVSTTCGLLRGCGHKQIENFEILDLLTCTLRYPIHAHVYQNTPTGFIPITQMNQM